MHIEVRQAKEVMILDLKGRLKPGAYTALLALALGDNFMNPEVATAQFRVEAGP